MLKKRLIGLLVSLISISTSLYPNINQKRISIRKDLKEYIQSLNNIKELELNDPKQLELPVKEMFCLVDSIIMNESGYNEKAKNREENVKDWSIGLMQIRCATARRLGLRGKCWKLLDGKTNMYFGVKYVRQQLRRFNTVEEVIVAYNAGSVFKCKSSGKYVNQKYFEKVNLSYWNCLLNYF